MFRSFSIGILVVDVYKKSLHRRNCTLLPCQIRSCSSLQNWWSSPPFHEFTSLFLRQLCPNQPLLSIFTNERKSLQYSIHEVIIFWERASICIWTCRSLLANNAVTRYYAIFCSLFSTLCDDLPFSPSWSVWASWPRRRKSDLIAIYRALHFCDRWLSLANLLPKSD